MLLRRIKPFLGLALVVAAAAGLYFWETAGREALLTTEVLTITAPVKAGEILSADMVEARSYLSENVAKGAVSPSDEREIIGKVARCDLSEGIQLNSSYLAVPEEMASELAPFVLPAEWIASRSAGLRAGDLIEVYSADGTENFGIFKIAYVRDDKENPVTDVTGFTSGDRWERCESSGQIENVEIAAKLSDYLKIREYVYGEEVFPVNGLLIVQKGEEL